MYVFDAESSYPLTENDELTVLNMHMNVSRGMGKLTLYRPIPLQWKIPTAEKSVPEAFSL